MVASERASRLERYLRDATRRLPDKVAIVCGDTRITFGELAERTNRLARALRTSGVEVGDRVVMFMNNTVDAATAFWAILAAGAIAVPVHPSTKAERLRWLLAHCRASALLGERSLVGAIGAAVRSGAPLRALLIADLQHDETLATARDFESSITSESPEPLPPLDTDGNELATIIYTSGSTGFPKGVMLSHRNMIAAASSICEYLALREDDVVHGIMPLSFDTVSISSS